MNKPIRIHNSKSKIVDLKENHSIYMILNKISGKFYIGSSKNYKGRWSVHIHLLNKNNHFNKHLQNSWNKHGADKFEFSIIMNVLDKNELHNVEEYYLKYYFKYFRKKLFNITDKADKILGAGNIVGILNPKAKLNENKVIEIRRKYKQVNKSIGEKYRLLGKEYNVSPLTISRIIRNISWTHI